MDASRAFHAAVYDTLVWCSLVRRCSHAETSTAPLPAASVAYVGSYSADGTHVASVRVMSEATTAMTGKILDIVSTTAVTPASRVVNRLFLHRARCANSLGTLGPINI